jgi:NADH-quinone oxidoreductase subunit A
MPESYLETYFPILLQVFIAMAVAAGMIGASFFLGKRWRNRAKDSVYECGMTPVGTARERFSVKFYLVAMIFILFDVEVVFLYPWAVVYDQLKLYGFVVMFLFVDLVLWGYFYIWKKGVLDWGPEPQAVHRS